MSEQTENVLRDRLAGMTADRQASQSSGRPKSSAVKLAAFLGGAAALAGGVYFYTQPDGVAGLGVRRPGEFQTVGAGFGDIDRPEQEQAQGDPEPVAEQEPAPLAASDNSEVVELIRGLQTQIDGLNTPNPENSSDPENTEAAPQTDDAALIGIRADLARLGTESAARETSLQDTIGERNLQIERLNNEIDMLRLEGGRSVVSGSDDNLLDQQRQAAEDAAQMEQQRVQSSMIAIGGEGAGGVGAEGGEAGAAQQAARLSDDAQFVRDAGRPVSVQRAEIIVNPGNTITQGTMIQAVLETAIDSTLEGPIRGLVTTDVVSYDGSRILIPRGSKLIGSYAADVDTGQNRLLIAWERIIMPDNQSVQISSFGADALGRSGTTGKINNHFLKRFGSAALISTIAAIPTFLEDDSADSSGVTISTGGTAGVATGAADALGGATEGATGKYLSIPPTISVAQGTRITVMVDRDLEVF